MPTWSTRPRGRRTRVAFGQRGAVGDRDAFVGHVAGHAAGRCRCCGTRQPTSPLQSKPRSGVPAPAVRGAEQGEGALQDGLDPVEVLGAALAPQQRLSCWRSGGIRVASDRGHGGQRITERDVRGWSVQRRRLAASRRRQRREQEGRRGLGRMRRAVWPWGRAVVTRSSRVRTEATMPVMAGEGVKRTLAGRD